MPESFVLWTCLAAAAAAAQPGPSELCCSLAPAHVPMQKHRCCCFCLVSLLFGSCCCHVGGEWLSPSAVPVVGWGVPVPPCRRGELANVLVLQEAGCRQAGVEPQVWESQGDKASGFASSSSWLQSESRGLNEPQARQKLGLGSSQPHKDNVVGKRQELVFSTRLSSVYSLLLCYFAVIYFWKLKKQAVLWLIM